MKSRAGNSPPVSLLALVIAVGLMALGCTSTPTQHTRPHGPARTTGTGGASLDDLFLRVASAVPAFGGLFVDNDGTTLAVQLRDTSPGTVVAVRKELVQVFGAKRIGQRTFRAVQAQYGFADLEAMRDRARAVLSLSGVVSLDADERQNRVRIGVRGPGVQAEVESEIAKLGIPHDAVLIEVEQPIDSAVTLQNNVRPLMAGLQIASPLGNCSLGLVVVRSGVRGFLTASHCTTTYGGLDGTVFGQPNTATQIGTEAVDPPYVTGGNCPSGRRCGLSDSAFAALSSGVTSVRGAILEADSGGIGITVAPSYLYTSAFNVVGEAPAPWEGEKFVMKVGRTTGLSEGDVLQTCEDGNPGLPNGGDSGVTLFCQDEVGAASAKGDSGGPVFVTENGLLVKILGILWGRRFDNSGFMFSRIAFVEQELGAMNVVRDNGPPTVSISQPTNGATVGYGGLNMVQFQASTSDLEEGSGCCTVTWKSDKDGPMGTGTSIQFGFGGPGTRIVTATATDAEGATASRSITVQATANTAPSVSIKEPSPGETLYVGVPKVFLGDSWDSETFGDLPCNALKWTSSNVSDSTAGAFPKTGCTPQVTFNTSGQRTITLAGTDEAGAVGNASVTVNVADPATSRTPVVSILSPKPDQELKPELLTSVYGVAVAKSPATYTLVLKYGSTETTLATGAPGLWSGSPNGVAVSRLWRPGDSFPFTCGGWLVQIILRVTDADGKTGSASVHVSIPYPVC